VLNIGNTWSASLQATGALKPFDDATMTEIGGADRFLAGSLAATGAEGQPPTAVPLYSLAYGLYYNKAMFAEAGITEPPATWADLIAAGKKLTTPERWGMSIEGGSVSENIHNVFVFSEQQGGSFFDDAGKPTFDTPENVAGVKQYLDLIQTDKITNPSNAEYSNGTEALADFASGKSAMVMWQAAAGSLEELGMDPADIGVAPIPAPAGGEDVASIVAGINLAVFENTEHEQQALDFVEFMTSTPTQIELNKTYGSLPAVNEAYSDPAFQTEAVETFKSILDTQAVPMPAVPEESQFETLIGTAVKNMLAQAASGTVVTEQAISEQLAAAQQQLAG
jgi:multiple sugar transport system substrate-binding protein